jgi:hypothetical protein
MKKARSSSRSAHIPVRLVVALALCLAALSLAGRAFGSWEGLSLTRWVDSLQPTLPSSELETGNNAPNAPDAASTGFNFDGKPWYYLGRLSDGY